MKDFFHLLERMEEYKRLKAYVERGGPPVSAVGLSAIHKAHFIGALSMEQEGKTTLVITQDEPSAIRMCADLCSMMGEEEAVYFPSREYIYRELDGASREYEHQRLSVLGRVLKHQCRVVVASIESAAQFTMPKSVLQSATLTLSQEGSYKMEEVISFLHRHGYELREQVEGICQYAYRGGILDFFPPHTIDPVRVEFWGDEIDSLATFKVDTQRRSDSLKSITITPGREVLCEDPQKLLDMLELALASLKGKSGQKAAEHLKQDIDKLESGIHLSQLDRYLPLIYREQATILDYTDGAVYLCEPVSCKESLKNMLMQHQEDVKILLEEGILFKGCTPFYLDFTELSRILTGKTAILMDTFARSVNDIPLGDLIDIHAIQLSSWSGELSVLCEDLIEYRRGGFCTVIFAGTPKTATALTADLTQADIPADYVKDVTAFLPTKVYVVEGTVSSGFEYPDCKLCILTQGKALAAVKRRTPRHKQGDNIRNISDLTVGDYVVHVSHGIGVFEGIVKREIHGVIKDYIKIRYAGTDTLFVPVTQLDLVTKYIGGREDSSVRLSKLNSAEWQKTRQRVKAAVKDMAQELIKLYSVRLNAKGYAFGEDTDWQNDFEQRFPYEETDDQLRCIRELKADMEKEMPMDRLLCGDVGFGKTEVALRGAFKCVMEGKQCAILVPTTILAWQHYQTFLKRMSGFPIKVELLSRFRTPKQQEEIIKELRRGEIDIIIGTHRLVQKDVQFKDLGLCIIDEEQRFGVAHKEKFKEMRSNVDVLTLSATPIPRTLNMAMSGIRDMSIIEEAPQDRQPVQTYVIEHDWGLIAEAIKRELRRDGQVFYLHNRVETISRCAMKLQELVPEARIVVGHGKMNEEQLSGVWKSLVEHEVDILVCTTIIETGVDVTNCNTLIIEEADRMGLSQLYQLRGRVGRSSRRAFAYMTVSKGKALTDIATKRLSAIREFTTFGSGFRIAMRDLEIRGAGNILGAQQHGHMEAVGYEMYLKLLSEAVALERGETPQHKAEECLIDIRIGAHIPEEYIENLSQRIDIYKKIAAISSGEDAEDILDELIDRFGDPPKAVQGLVDVALLRGTAARMGIREIAQNGDSLILKPEHFDLNRAGMLAAKLKGRVLVNAGKEPYISVRILKTEQPIDAMRLALEAMETAQPTPN